MSERIRVTVQQGHLSIDIEAESYTTLPKWIDAQGILRAAIREYERQMNESGVKRVPRDPGRRSV